MYSEEDLMECPEDDDYQGIPNEDGIDADGINRYDYCVM